MHKIYYGEKSLTILSPSEVLTQNQKNNTTFSYPGEALVRVLEALKTEQTQSCLLVANNPEEALNAFKKHYLVLQAGGGLVHTHDGHLLLIFRRGKWDLPKGKLDIGENIAACAIREVEEETGVASPVLREKILITYHTYCEKGKEILKESHWYSMFVPEKQNLKPQTEEDIEVCEWVHINDVHRYKENMHPSVKDVLDQGLKQITP